MFICTSVPRSYALDSGDQVCLTCYCINNWVILRKDSVDSWANLFRCQRGVYRLSTNMELKCILDDYESPFRGAILSPGFGAEI